MSARRQHAINGMAAGGRPIRVPRSLSSVSAHLRQHLARRPMADHLIAIALLQSVSPLLLKVPKHSTCASILNALPESAACVTDQRSKSASNGASLHIARMELLPGPVTIWRDPDLITLFAHHCLPSTSGHGDSAAQMYQERSQGGYR